MRQIETATFDLIVLDIMLPGMDGWQLLTWTRARGLQTPVLILTARDAVSDRVRGLEVGADDYLVKPFAFSELLARVRTILRRPPLRESSVLRVATSNSTSWRTESRAPVIGWISPPRSSRCSRC